MAESPPRMPRLELISRLPRGEAFANPILFVHGSFIGAWCWAEHFLPYFAEQGYAAHAVSLRGHGASEGHDGLRQASLADYAADLERAVAEVGGAPILVGHSMGGMVVQKYLERCPARAAVLMASIPPQGLGWMMSWLALTNPWLLFEIGLIHWGGARFAHIEWLRRALFSSALPDALARRYLARMQDESQRVMWDMSGWDLPMAPHVPESLLVLGARNDALVPTLAVRATALRFGVYAEIFPTLSHVMMLEPGWRAVADHMLEWLALQGLRNRSIHR
ncbi:MAG: alpha/beta fold hydrolase [Gammaproteobacteria bacterium]